MFLIYQKIFKVAVVSLIQAFAVSPEIVPAPESHRSVVLLISSQNHITFRRSLNFQRLMKKQITAVNENMFMWTNDLYGIIFLQV